MKTEPIRVLLIEDNWADAALIRELQADTSRPGFELEHAPDLTSAKVALAQRIFDLVLLDLGLPETQGLSTFTKAHAFAQNIPIIVLTGLNDESLALKAVQMGAQDYLVKGGINAHLLIRSMRYAVERQKLLTEIQQTLREIKTLRGLLPICAGCKKIRDDKGYWTQIEVYVSQHSEAEFSHGLCPDCVQRLYARFVKPPEAGAGENQGPETGPQTLA